MKLLIGKKISEDILIGLRSRISRKKTKLGLAVILIGKNPASDIYAKLKEKAAKKIGIKFYLHKFKRSAKKKKIIEKIKKLNNNQKINGIIVQLPLPKKFHAQKIINAIDPRKDADGFNPQNIKLFLNGKGEIFPVLPKAIMKILEAVPRARLSEAKKAVIAANSKLFGEAMKTALKQKNIKANYILAKAIKKELIKIRSADIVISVVGKPGFIKGEMIKKGAIIIDAGITKRGKKVLGDVDFNSVKNKASYLTPVPGGVGPVTIACLLKNVYLLSKKSH